MHANDNTQGGLYDKIDQAMQDGNLNAVKLLVQNDNTGQQRPLATMAASYPHLDIMKYVVEELGADVTHGDGLPLFYALLNGHVDIAAYLYDAGNIDICEGDNKALCWAIEGGHIASINFALQQGADMGRLVEYLMEWSMRDDANAQNATWLEEKSPEAYQWCLKLMENPDLIWEEQRQALLTAQQDAAKDITSKQRNLRRFVRQKSNKMTSPKK